MTRREQRKKGPVESIVFGAVFAGVFGTLFFANGGFDGSWWWIFPAVFAGVLPLLDGVRRLVFGKKEKQVESQGLEDNQEKQILQAAYENKGRLTASKAALHTSLPIRAAQKILERMVKEGHAAMNVTSSGTIEYEFPDFLPQKDNDKYSHSLLD